MRTTGLLVSTAAAWLTVACSGTSPTSPGPVVSHDETVPLAGTEASQDVALTGALPSPDSLRTRPCQSITEVRLRLLRTRDLRIEAGYVGGGPVNCGVPPIWTSSPSHRLEATPDPFVVKVLTERRRAIVVLITAQAPNGVIGRIEIRP
jgi:hypothetical protein